MSASLLLYTLIHLIKVPSPDNLSSANSKKAVEVIQAERGNITETVKLMGTIRAKRSTVLVAKNTGILEQIAHAGDHVKKGSLIAKLQIPSIEKTYELSKHAASIAREQYERLAKLYKNKISSSRELEDHHKTWIEAQKAVSTAKTAYDNIHFEAPFDGVMGVYKFHEGTHVQEGSVIGTIYDPTELIVEFDIPSPHLKKLSKTPTVLINNQKIPPQHIQKIIDEETHMSPAYVDFTCQNDCIIGTTIPVELVLEERQNVILIPFEAVFLRKYASFVYVVKENKAVLTPVTLGVQQKEKVEITEGLKEGDPIIAVGHNRLYPDEPVQIVEHDQKIS